MAAQLATGWYPDPNDASSEIYWDGTQWHGRRDALPASLSVPGSPGPGVTVAGVSNLPTRKFWITAILLIAAALAVIFWLIPAFKESNEELQRGYEMMHEKCLDEKRSAGMDIFRSAEECKHWLDN